MFRQRALEHQQNPERLDQLMQVVTLSNWIPLLSLGVLGAGLVVWSFVARIPVTVMGSAALIYPLRAAGEAQVVQIESRGSGPLVDLRVKRGDLVTKGQIMAVIDMPQTRTQLESLRAELSSAQDAIAKRQPIESQKDRVEREALERQRRDLATRIAQLDQSGTAALASQIEALAGQRKALDIRRKDAARLTGSLKKAWETRKGLQARGVLSEAVVFEAERQYLDSIHDLNDLENQIRDIESRRLEVRRTYLEAKHRIASLEGERRDLQTREKALDIAYLQAQGESESRIRGLEQQVSDLESQLRTQGLVVSDYDGRVLEVAGIVGQVVGLGTKLGALQIVSLGDEASSSAGLQGVAYFTVGDGKRIQPGMTVQLTPATVKREEFGGIVGTVAHVSAFAVSRDSAANLVNSSDVAAQLTKDGKTIEVFVDLQADPGSRSGYRWSASQGPKIPITAGTTGEARVTVERMAPISLILPIMRSVSGD
ncbi:MAG: NHLP bacteriocin system secretion protein [Candidatus Sericytochromatia bacterium]|nr:NHLP bacteriocin system secretion protein [Candidatus Tanganyikabacteria bacterium]